MMGIVAQQAMMNAFPASYIITVGNDDHLYGVYLDSAFPPTYGNIAPNPAKVSPEPTSWIINCSYDSIISALNLDIVNYSMALVLANIESITIDGNVFAVSARNAGFDVDDRVVVNWQPVSNPFGTTIGATKILTFDYL